MVRSALVKRHRCAPRLKHTVLRYALAHYFCVGCVRPPRLRLRLTNPLHSFIMNKMPDPWAVLSDRSPTVQSLRSFKNRFDSSTEVDLPLLESFGKILQICNSAFAASRSQQWWQAWKKSMECTLLQHCMVAALGAVPAATQCIVSSQASDQDRNAVLLACSACLHLVHKAEPIQPSSWLFNWMRIPGRLEIIMQAALSVSSIPVRPGEHAAIHALFTWEATQISSNLMALHDPERAVRPDLHVGVLSAALRTSTSLIRKYYILGPEHQSFRLRPQTFIEQRSSSFSEEGRAEKDGYQDHCLPIWLISIERCKSQCLAVRQEGGTFDGSRLAENDVWKSLIPTLLQAHQLGIDLLCQSDCSSLSAGFNGFYTSGIRHIMDVLCSLPTACIQGPMWLMKAAATTLRTLSSPQLARPVTAEDISPAGDVRHVSWCTM